MAFQHSGCVSMIWLFWLQVFWAWKRCSSRHGGREVFGRTTLHLIAISLLAGLLMLMCMPAGLKGLFDQCTSCPHQSVSGA